MKPLVVNTDLFVRKKYNWEKYSRLEIECSYSMQLKELLSDIDISNLESDQGKNAIDSYHSKIVYSMQQAASVTIKQRKFCRHLKPGWKQPVAPIHEAMRERRRQWIYAGRPRDINNPYYRNHKDTKRIFRRELRTLFNDLEKDFVNELDHAAVFDQCRSWTLINRKRKRRGVKINELKAGDTVYREPAEILLAWERYFSDLYTIKTDRKYDSDNFTRIDNLVETYKRESVHSHDDILDSPISNKEVSCHIKNLNKSSNRH